MKRYIKSSINLSEALSLSHDSDHIYVAELTSGTLILIQAGPARVIGLDYVGDRLIGSYGSDKYGSAIDNFLKAPSSAAKHIARLAPYSNELEALEGETRVKCNDMVIDCPANKKVSGRNILDVGRKTNIFTDYSFNDVVELVNTAKSAPYHIASNTNYGYGTYTMICTLNI